MIQVNAISKTFTTSKGRQVSALKEVSFSVDKGEIFGIIGSSGAGKSTILRCLNLLETPDSGDILVDNKSLLQLSLSQLQQERRNIGMIFQHFNLLSSRTIFENVSLPLELEKRPKGEITTRVNALLELVGILDKANDYPNQLSGGQKQRVAIARALATNPSILLCDEATSALDPETTKSILNLLQRINKEFSITIVLITHEIQVVKSICDRVAIVSKGEVVEIGPREQIFGSPKTAYVRTFIQNAVQTELPIKYASQLSLTWSPETPNAIIRWTPINTTQLLLEDINEKITGDLEVIEAHIETVGHLKLASYILLVHSNSDSNIHEWQENVLLDHNIEILGYVSRSI